LLVAAIGAVSLVFGAADGNASVTSITSAAQLAATNLDNAYYRCLDVQTRSLVAPNQPVTFYQHDNVADLLRASGRWLVAAPQSDVSVPQLLLVSRPGPGSCHGAVVEARVPLAGGGTVVRVGTGASLSGSGPLPRPQL
jgi:hypothetical protein